MNQPQIRFDDGAAYEAFMGKWSQLVGIDFLHWLSPPPGWRWLDVGCGNGAFTELLVRHCAPAEVHGIDPSEEQLAFARSRASSHAVRFQRGDALALPHTDAAFDAAVMALVIFFVPDPARSVAEMARVTRPGGSMSAYAWDMLGGGFPFAAVYEEMTELGAPPASPPSVDAARIEVMRSLWEKAGLVGIETREISVQRSFDNFDSFWEIARTGPRIAPAIAAMPPADVELLKARLRSRLAVADGLPVTYAARANAIKGTAA